LNTEYRFTLPSGEEVIIDEEDREYVTAFKWRMGGGGYAQRHVWVEGKKRTQTLHRMLLDPPPHRQVDHANGNRLDNRRANIRVCNAAQNLRNVPKTKRPTSSTFKGVSKRSQERGGGWVVKITTKKYAGTYVGVFQDEVEAARAYDRAALYHYGEFARINFPTDAKPSGMGSYLYCGELITPFNVRNHFPRRTTRWVPKEKGKWLGDPRGDRNSEKKTAG
jgi:hypothetical protein